MYRACEKARLQQIRVSEAVDIPFRPRRVFLHKGDHVVFFHAVRVEAFGADGFIRHEVDGGFKVFDTVGDAVYGELFAQREVQIELYAARRLSADDDARLPRADAEGDFGVVAGGARYVYRAVRKSASME